MLGGFPIRGSGDPLLVDSRKGVSKGGREIEIPSPFGCSFPHFCQHRNGASGGTPPKLCSYINWFYSGNRLDCCCLPAALLSCFGKKVSKESDIGAGS